MIRAAKEARARAVSMCGLQEGKTAAEELGSPAAVKGSGRDQKRPLRPEIRAVFHGSGTTKLPKARRAK